MKKGLMMKVNEPEDVGALSVETSLGHTVSLLGGIMIANHKAEISVISHLDDESGSFQTTLKVQRIPRPVSKLTIGSPGQKTTERQENGENKA